MIPFGDKTVTLYHRELRPDGGTGKTRAHWMRCVYSGCSFRVERTSANVDTTRTNTSPCVCRIPGLVPADIGDVVVLGNVSETVETGANAEALVQKYAATGAMCVTSVRVNTDAPTTPHTALRG